MAAKKTNANTRELIISASKKLFYKNGYKATRYKDICAAINISPGTFNYFFKKKETLAGLVIKEFAQNLHKIICQHHKKQNDLRYLYIFEYIVYYEILKDNTHFLKFYLELCDINILNKYTQDTTFDFIQTYLVHYGLNIDPRYMNPFGIVSNHLQSALVTSYFNHDIELGYDEMIDLCITTQFAMYHEDENLIRTAIAKARENIPLFPIKMVDDFELIL